MKNHVPVVWSHFDFSSKIAPPLRDELASRVRLVVTDEKNLGEAEIAFGQPAPQAVLDAPRLRWVHLSSAGYTDYDLEDFKDALRQRNIALTNSSHVYDEPCAQHVLAMMLAFARRLPQSLDNQRGAHAWNTPALRADSFLLNEQNVVLLGYGAIVRRMIQLLQPFDMKIVAVRRAEQGDETVRVVTPQQLPEVLSRADHVVNALPENEATKHFVDADFLAHMKRGAYFYNIGRGATVQQDALMDALHSGQIGAAYLDVMTPEPLPPEHPLWTAPNCYLTPHTGGGHRNEHERLVRHFLNNLQRFQRGAELLDRIV